LTVLNQKKDTQKKKKKNRQGAGGGGNDKFQTPMGRKEMKGLYLEKSIGLRDNQGEGITVLQPFHDEEEN